MIKLSRMNTLNRTEGWLRGLDLNQRPLGYEPNELPDCSTPHCEYSETVHHCQVVSGPSSGAVQSDFMMTPLLCTQGRGLAPLKQDTDSTTRPHPSAPAVGYITGS